MVRLGKITLGKGSRKKVVRPLREGGGEVKAGHPRKNNFFEALKKSSERGSRYLEQPWMVLT